VTPGFRRRMTLLVLAVVLVVAVIAAL